MPEPRFRTQRCRHHLAVGLCEDRTCEGHKQARLGPSAVADVKPPRCSFCKQRRADALVRVASPNKRQLRHCIGCWENRTVREESTELRKRLRIAKRANLRQVAERMNQSAIEALHKD